MSEPTGQMGEEARKSLNEKLEQKSDFRGKCVKCRVTVVGTLQELRDHVCEEQSDANRQPSS